MNDDYGSPKNIHKCTPPTEKKVRNPFDKALIARLHKPICSPSMCKIYKKRSNGLFRWDIDQECTLVPKDIVPCNSQFEPSPDPALERIAEEATERFFSQELVMPSPIESSKKIKPLHISYDSNTSVHINSYITQEAIIKRDVSAQTIITLPPVLPTELEKMLEKYCTFTHDQDISGEYEITANGSMRRKLLFEEHSDMEHYDSEQTDDEVHVEKSSTSSFEVHTPVVFSPDLSQNAVLRGMKRTFGTPNKKDHALRPGYRNKLLDVVDFGEACFSPIQFQTPRRAESSLTSSIASTSISPVSKVTSSDEKKNNLSSPEADKMATCLDCIVSAPGTEKKGLCFCSTTPERSHLKRSKSLKDTPPRSRKGSFSVTRSLSMSSLHRSRSVQKLDFSMDMSFDASMHSRSQEDVIHSPEDDEHAWPITETSISGLETGSLKTFTTENIHLTAVAVVTNKLEELDETPIKGKCKSNVLSHDISKIRTSKDVSVLQMSLDCSLDSENPLSLEDKKVDFTTVDLKFLTENVSQFDNTANGTKAVSDSSSSFKKVDSGFNENTFYASSYYESAIKPSELTVTDTSKVAKTALKEISNVHWMRADSGFKDENSTDNGQFFVRENSMKNATSFGFSETVLEEKENNFDRFFFQSANKNDAMSMSDIFNEDMKFNCNFSSTPSKNKARKYQ